ncbi:FkbM family methyltransferase [Streptomyces sp. NPDC059063]|uniref:FkbM family methyltransferase n=1 Tax=unclassified Streptomyces TaxID=2593676 RepID=UPI0036B9CD22
MSSAVSEVLATLGRRYVRDAPWTAGKAALATRYLNPWLREHPRRRVTASLSGARFAVDTQDLIQRYIYLFGVWEPHMSRWLRGRLRPGDVFVDVGANIGYLSVLGAQLVGAGGRVVAIEASPDFHRRLLQHRDLNACDNIRAVNAAVSDRHEKLTFVLASAHNMGANSVVPWDGPVESSFETEAVPLPELLEPDEIARARVIKVDVEGAEGSVVRGLAPLLDRLRPDAEIAVEVTPDRMAQLGESADELIETMRAHGFHAYRLVNDYAPGSYPAAVRQARGGPVRWRQPVGEGMDLIFSRVDAESLA